MPKSDAWFEGEGKGLKNKLQPMPVRFPEEIDAILRAMPKRQDFIRAAVLEKMQREGLLGDAIAPKQETPQQDAEGRSD